MYRQAPCSARAFCPRKPPPQYDGAVPLPSLRPPRSERHDFAAARSVERRLGIGALRKKLEILPGRQQQGPLAALRHAQGFRGLNPLQRNGFMAVALPGRRRRCAANKKMSIEALGEHLRGDPMSEFDE